MTDEARGHRATSSGAKSALDLTNLPPGPYDCIILDGASNGNVHIKDANGRNIAACWGSPAEKAALACLIMVAQEYFTGATRMKEMIGATAEKLVDEIRGNHTGANFLLSRDEAMHSLLIALATASITAKSIAAAG